MSYINWKVENEIGFLTVNRPPVNALNREVLAEMSLTLEQIHDTCRVVILSGNGEKAFVAGADIQEFPELRKKEGEQLCLIGQSIFQQVAELNQPVIAAIDGYTLGGGLELALACDFRLATKTSLFGFPEVKLGIIPGYGGTQRLSRLIGPGKAKQLIFSGEMISGEEAHRIGIIEEVVEDDVMSMALKWANIIALRGPLAVQTAKKAINLGMDMDLAEGLSAEASLFAGLCETKDKNEGVMAFLERREAKFTGK